MTEFEHQKEITLQLTEGEGMDRKTDFIQMIWQMNLPRIGETICHNEMEYSVTDIIYDLETNKISVIALN